MGRVRYHKRLLFCCLFFGKGMHIYVALVKTVNFIHRNLFGFHISIFNAWTSHRERSPSHLSLDVWNRGEQTHLIPRQTRREESKAVCSCVNSRHFIDLKSDGTRKSPVNLTVGGIYIYSFSFYLILVQSTVFSNPLLGITPVEPTVKSVLSLLQSS